MVVWWKSSPHFGGINGPSLFKADNSSSSRDPRRQCERIQRGLRGKGFGFGGRGKQRRSWL